MVEMACGTGLSLNRLNNLLGIVQQTKPIVQV
jgi:hypothetical protein